MLAGHSKEDKRARNEGLSGSTVRPLLWVPPTEAFFSSLWVCSLWFWVVFLSGFHSDLWCAYIILSSKFVCFLHFFALLVVVYHLAIIMLDKCMFLVLVHL